AAVSANNYLLVQALLKAGADPNVTDDMGRTGLMLLGSAADVDDTEGYMADLFFEYKADPNIKDMNGRTALNHAIIQDRLGLIQELIVAKADVNSLDNRGNPPLEEVHIGTREGYMITKLLINSGADVNIGLDHPRNPFDNAIYYAPSALLTLYSLVNAGIRSTPKLNDPRYAAVKTYISVLKKEIIGKPAAQLFEAMIDQRRTVFVELLAKTVISDSVRNYLYMANLGGEYSATISNALMTSGAADNFVFIDPDGNYKTLCGGLTLILTVSQLLDARRRGNVAATDNVQRP
ncbi:MAG: ankyrin repeat domain-containing protein, partial [Cytophagaceae bacterium]